MSCLLLGYLVGVWLTSTISMIIPYTLQAFYRRISSGEPDGDRVYDAMVQATKGSSRYTRSRKACDLLVKLRRSGLAVNEVEHSVERTCQILSEKQ